jgi:hypothetical protein
MASKEGAIILSLALNKSERAKWGQPTEGGHAIRTATLASQGYLNSRQAGICSPVTYDGTIDKLTLYLDGAQIDQITSAGATNMSTPAVHIGSDNDPWDGKVDDVRLYNRTLTAAEVKQLYKTVTVRQ